jgi:N-acetylglutamate synthase-like GNAT family acetyltransferase
MRSELVERIIQKNYGFLKGMYTDEVEETKFGLLSASSVDYGDTDVFWNHGIILDRKANLDSATEKARDFLEKRGKSLAFYLPSHLDNSITSNLEEENLQEFFTDVWMVYSEYGTPEANEDIELEKVNDREEMERFVDLFYRSHAADLDDPYAGLSEKYGEQLKKKFSQDFENFQVKHFIVKLEGEAVGHFTTIKDTEMAGIYNLGTVPEQRGKGIASGTLRKIIEKLRTEDLEKIFLQTEKGSENEEFFSKRGFETRFEAKCLVEEEN